MAKRLNAFLDEEKTKLAGISIGAEVNNISDINATDLTDGGDSTLHYHASDRDRSNHTGTQTASTISDFDTEVSNNVDVAANTAKVSANGSVTTHNDVTDAGSGSIITSLERSKLGGIEDSAEVNNISDINATDLTDGGDSTLHYHSADRDRNNHTGTQTAATISDFDTEVSNNSSVTANTAKVSFPEAPIDGSYYARKDGGWASINGDTIGAGYFDAVVLTTCTNSGTWYKVDAVFTPQAEVNFSWDGVNKRWNYTGDGTTVSVFTTFTGAHDDTSARTMEWEFRKNGLQLPNPGKLSLIEAGDPMSMSLMVPVLTVATNDYIELWVKMDSSGDNAKTSKMNLLIR